MTFIETRRNIWKDKKHCFVCLKAGRISEVCLSKIKCYKCSKRHQVVIFLFEKIDNNTQVSENHTPITDDSTKEEINVNFNSPSNTVLLPIAITTIENANIQCKVRILFDSDS